MDAGERKIEIFAPFTSAIELTKLILFQPFDLTKWLTIGFAAFLAGLADGTRMTFGTSWSGDDWSGKSLSSGAASFGNTVDWVLFAVIFSAIFIFVVAVITLFMWLGSRGRFMFIDCIVRNRGAIEEPWREFRREGNSLFLLMIAAGFVWLLIAALVAVPIFLPLLLGDGQFTFGVWQIVYLLTAVVLFVVVAVIWMLVAWFIPPVMYRQRCGPVVALRQVVNLIGENPVPFILFLLFAIVLVIGGGMLTFLVCCVTCCVAMLPYIGTVILLPLYTFYYSYGLLFLRQFGPEYDVWGGILPLPQAAAPAADPAVEEERPPAEETRPPSNEPPPLP